MLTPKSAKKRRATKPDSSGLEGLWPSPGERKASRLGRGIPRGVYVGAPPDIRRGAARRRKGLPRGPHQHDVPHPPGDSTPRKGRRPATTWRDLVPELLRSIQGAEEAVRAIAADNGIQL
jgi:hypothetical protein